MANALKTLFTDIATAIRSKTGSTDKITPNDFPTAINSILVGSGEGEEMKIELLWTNPAPYDDYSGGTITFDGKYKMYAIALLSGEESSLPSDAGTLNLYPVLGRGELLKHDVYDFDSISGTTVTGITHKLYLRNATLNEDSITFAATGFTRFVGSANTGILMSAAYGIPYKIWGIS